MAALAALLPLPRAALEPFWLLCVELFVVVTYALVVVGVVLVLPAITAALLVDRNELLIFVCDEWGDIVDTGGGGARQRFFSITLLTKILLAPLPPSPPSGPASPARHWSLCLLLRKRRASGTVETLAFEAEGRSPPPINWCPSLASPAQLLLEPGTHPRSLLLPRQPISPLPSSSLSLRSPSCPGLVLEPGAHRPRRPQDDPQWPNNKLTAGHVHVLDGLLWEIVLLGDEQGASGSVEDGGDGSGEERGGEGD